MKLIEIVNLDISTVAEETERLFIEKHIKEYLNYLKIAKNEGRIEETVFKTCVSKFNSIKAKFKNQRIAAGILNVNDNKVIEVDTSPPIPEGYTLIHFDGSISKNPGGLAVGGCVAYLPNNEKATNYLTMENSTNNVAEYLGLISALKLGLNLGLTRLYIKGDSQLVVRQVNRENQVNTGSLYTHFKHASLLKDMFDDVILVHVRRYFNKEADKLVYKKMKELTNVHSCSA